jgi:hypothetical protein
VVRFTPQPLNTRERAVSTHFIGGCGIKENLESLPCSPVSRPYTDRVIPALLLEEYQSITLLPNHTEIQIKFKLKTNNI